MSKNQHQHQQQQHEPLIMTPTLSSASSDPRASQDLKMTLPQSQDSQDISVQQFLPSTSNLLPHQPALLDAERLAELEDRAWAAACDWAPTSVTKSSPAKLLRQVSPTGTHPKYHRLLEEEPNVGEVHGSATTTGRETGAPAARRQNYTVVPNQRRRDREQREEDTSAILTINEDDDDTNSRTSQAPTSPPHPASPPSAAEQTASARTPPIAAAHPSQTATSNMRCSFPR